MLSCPTDLFRFKELIKLIILLMDGVSMKIEDKTLFERYFFIGFVMLGLKIHG